MHFSTFAETFFARITDRTEAEARKLSLKISEIVGRNLKIHGVTEFERMDKDGNLRLVLGEGIFGLAAVSAEDTNKVVKLTTDPEEVTAAHMLIGQRLPHVVRFFHAGYLSGIRVKNVKTGMTQPLGITVAEKLDRIRVSSRDGNLKLREIVDDIQLEFRVEPELVMRMSPDLARRRLKKASIAMATRLRETDIDDLAEIADGVEELHSFGIFAVDFHPGNVGWSAVDMRHKVFDVGLASSPKRVKAPTLENPIEDGIELCLPSSFCWPAKAISVPEYPVPVLY